MHNSDLLPSLSFNVFISIFNFEITFLQGNIVNLTFESNTTNLDKFKYQKEIQIMENIINQAKILSKTYDIVITNPPYMGNSGMNPNLKDYLKKNFPNSK